MPYVPEATPFCLPPPGAPDIQTMAIYSHWAAVVICGLVTVAAFARSVKKGFPSHLAIGLGVAAFGGAAFAGENLYTNFLYGETARSATETRLFLAAIGAALVTGGVAALPGFRHKRFPWLTFAIPVLALAGFAVAGVGQLPAVGPGAILGAVGGVLVAIAGGLHLFDKAGDGKNPQERPASSLGFALVISGVLTALGASFARSEGGIDKGTMALAVSEAAFALFTLFAILSVEGSPADFKKAAPVKAAPAKKPAGAYVPPPPPGSAPPPPPGSVPPPPGAPRPSGPGGAPRPPGA